MRNNNELKQEIVRLKSKKHKEYKLLLDQLNHSYKEFTPSNIISSVVGSIAKKPLLKNATLESVLSIAGGYFSKLLIVGKSNSTLKSIVGYLVQIGATKLISKKIIK